MHPNITHGTLNRLIQSEFVYNKHIYEKSEYVFATSIYIPADNIISKLKSFTYLSGFVHLVESFNARVDAYIPEISDKCALVIFL